MEVDAAQYAQMSWQMLHSKNVLKLYSSNFDYLDKPPLLFWLNSLSFSVLGISNFSYKLPSLLFALTAIYSTYRFAKIYYSEQTARTAALMLATSQALFLITNDVRTDTILMGAVIFSIWQMTEFFETSRTKNLLYGSIGIALALLAKGPIGLIATAAALLPHLLWKKKLRQLLDARIFVSVLIIALLLTPMCIGLYQQFGTDGLKFYFWTQSFGRITGENKWNNHPDTFFLVHSTAWAFLPWSIFFFTGWIKSLVSFVRGKIPHEIISLSGFSLILLALSLSKYQLPHYIFVVFPLAAVIAANYFEEVIKSIGLKKFLLSIQGILIFGLFAVSVFLQYAFKGMELFSLLILTAMPVATGLLFYKTRNWLYTSSFAIIYFNIILSGFYNPEILKYQPESDFGKYIHEYANDKPDFISYKYGIAFSTVFYAQHLQTADIWDIDKLNDLLKEKRKLFVITGDEGLANLKANNIPFRLIQSRNTFPVSKLNWKFLNPVTRQQACQKTYLLQTKQSM